MIDRAAVLAELGWPDAVAAWLEARGTDALWRELAWAVAVDAGRRVLRNDSEGAWNPAYRRVLERDASPAVAAVLARLITHPRRRPWSARTVSALLCDHLGIANPGALRQAISRSGVPYNQEEVSPAT